MKSMSAQGRERRQGELVQKQQMLQQRQQQKRTDAEARKRSSH